MSITAFPVLCRILTELKLLETEVGVVTLAAGVGNDVVGWALLALTVSLVNAAAGGSGSSVNTVYILLCAIGWTIVSWFLIQQTALRSTRLTCSCPGLGDQICCWPMRKAFYYLAVRTGSIENGQPTPFMMTLTLFLVFASAFVTDIIGVHVSTTSRSCSISRSLTLSLPSYPQPIFGGFIAAFAIPHEGGFAIALVSKIEDIVTILFLPLYFTLSGLKTNLGLLDNGISEYLDTNCIASVECGD
jgi:Kef-type K+ transport system membrane component KefB